MPDDGTVDASHFPNDSCHPSQIAEAGEFGSSSIFWVSSVASNSVGS